MKLSNLLHKIKLGQTSRDMIVGIMIALLVGANLLIVNVPLRLDLSRGQAYSLSPSTQKIIKSLKDPVEITFFLSDNIPSSFLTTKNQVNDLLTEYKRSSSKISIKYIDPRKAGKDSQTLIQEFGIQETQFSQLESDQYAVSAGFFSLGIKSGDKKVAIQRIDPANLEYNISSIMYKLSQSGEIKVGVVGGSPAYLASYGQGPTESMGTLEQILGQQFTVENTDLTKLDQTVKTVVLLDGQTPVTDEAAGGIRKYLDGGGKVILFTSDMELGDSMVAASRESKLKPVLDTFGITLNQDLVLSNQAEIVNFGNDIFNRGKYPFWLMTNIFNPDASYTANVNYLMFPWTSSLSLTKKPNIIQKEIVRATKQSWVRTGPVDVKPDSITNPKTSELSQPLLIAYAKNSKTKGEIMVIPSTRFVQDNFLGRSGNLEFIVNLINEFASDGALSGIRSRAISALPLPALEPNTKDIFKWVNVLVLPALLGAWGVLRLKKRG